MGHGVFWFGTDEGKQPRTDAAMDLAVDLNTGLGDALDEQVHEGLRMVEKGQPGAVGMPQGNEAMISPWVNP